jgi:hypothetical protein
MRKLTFFSILITVSSLCPRMAMSQIQLLNIGFVSDTVYYGDYDTVARAFVSPTDSCSWTDTTHLTFDCAIGKTIMIDSSHAIAVGTIYWHGTLFTGAGARVNLSCGTSTLSADISIVAIDRASVKIDKSAEPMSSVFENPNHTFVMRITSPITDHLEICVYNSLGRQVYADRRAISTGLNEVELECAALPAGIYFYVIHGAEWNQSGKLVKLNP